MKIRRRVLVYASDSERVPYMLHRERAIAGIASGRLSVELRDGTETVIAVRLVAGHTGHMEDAKPGSFGISREHMAESGRLVFSHRRELYAGIIGR